VLINGVVLESAFPNLLASATGWKGAEAESSATRDAADVGHVVMVGMGYVGLPTALAMFDNGCDVTGFDISQRRLENIRAHAVDLIPEDHERLKRGAPLGQPSSQHALALSSDAACLSVADIIIIAVPTGITAHFEPDLEPLRNACATVVEHARAGQMIILTSTTYVGCTREMLADPLIERGFTPGVDICVAFSPERIDPGNVTHTQATVPRIVGGVTEPCGRAAAAVVKLASASVHLVSSDRAAEMTKLLENTFRAVNISWINEMADVAEEVGLDINEVIGAAATKPYGYMPFQPGPGVGGHCIPCDPHYLLWQLRATRTGAPITDSAMRSLAARPSTVANRALIRLAELGIRPSQAKVCIVGVAYKPGVQDVRESPALEIMRALHDRGVQVSYFDPYIPSLVGPRGIAFESIAAHEVASADLVIWHTNHPDFIPEELLAGAKVVIDATYRLDVNDLAASA
jgi:UDP-N-acetyl-D-glucosamine dehydrogenase